MCHWRTPSLLAIGVCGILRVYFSLWPVKWSKQTRTVPELSSRSVVIQMLATHPEISLLLHVSSFPLFLPSLCSYRVFWRFNMQTDDGWIISNSSFPTALAFSLFHQWQCFPFSATVRDTVHPPPLWPWLNDTINPTSGLLALDQIYHNLLFKVQIQLSLTLSVKIALKLFLFPTDTLNVIKTTALCAIVTSCQIRYQLHTRHT